MTDETTVIPDGAGRELGERARETVDTPIEEFVDVGVISWFEPYGRKVDAIRSSLPHAVRVAWTERTDGLLVDRPDARDAVRPAGWRSGLRFVGILAAVTAVAGVPLGVGFTRGSAEPASAAVVGLIGGIAAVVAALALGASLLRPAQMGRPSRMVSGLLWMSAIGSLGTAVVLPLRSATWDAATPVWWWVIACSGTVLLVLAIVVSAWRRRVSAASPIDDTEVGAMRVAVVQAQLDRAVAEVEAAWQRLDPAVREALIRERDAALEVIGERTPRALDADWVRSTVPGTMMLPHAADRAHSALHLGSAQLADRQAGGPHGLFVVQARSRR